MSPILDPGRAPTVARGATRRGTRPMSNGTRRERHVAWVRRSAGHVEVNGGHKAILVLAAAETAGEPGLPDRHTIVDCHVDDPSLAPARRTPPGSREARPPRPGGRGDVMSECTTRRQMTCGSRRRGLNPNGPDRHCDSRANGWTPALAVSGPCQNSRSVGGCKPSRYGSGEIVVTASSSEARQHRLA